MKRSGNNKFSLPGVIAMVVLAVSAGNPAQADDSGFYAGVGIGSSSTSISKSDIRNDLADIGITGTATSLDDSDTAWKLYGGYRFNPYLGLELGYVDLGSISSTIVTTAPSAANIHTSTDTDGFSLVAVGTWPVTSKFDLFAKVGAYHWNTDASATAIVGGSVVKVSDDDSGTDLTYGFGAGYRFTKNVGVRGEWEVYKDVAGYDIDLPSVSLEYRF
jgi:OOP family OmpA-OmpF porin